jgi:hypothetical protein
MVGGDVSPILTGKPITAISLRFDETLFYFCLFESVKKL